MPTEQTPLAALLRSRLHPRGNINQKELAKLLAVHEKTIRAWLTGTSKPRDGLRPRICDLLNVSMTDLAKACAGIEGGS